MSPLLFDLEARPGLAARLGGPCETGAFERRQFPDGETYFRYLTEVRDREVVLSCPLDRPDCKMIGLLLAADAARQQGARRVGLIAPYLAYMRQDRAFRSGEAITSAGFARLVSASFDWLVTVDPHLHRYRSLDEIYSIPSVAASAAAPIAGWLRDEVAKPLLIGPDAESEQWIREVAALAGARSAVLAKRRDGDFEVEIDAAALTTGADETPVILDDVISSAGTMAETVGIVRAIARRSPICIGVHAVFAGDALERLRLAGPARIVTTNTISHSTNGIDVSGEVQAALALIARA